MTIILMAQVRATDAAAADKVEKILQDIRDVSTSPAEPGCSMYYPTRKNDDPLQFMIFEEYADQAAVDAHMAGEKFQVLVANGNLLEGGLAAAKMGFYTRF